MSSFADCLREQISRHPYLTPRDALKLCHQAACGCEHLITDPDAVHKRLLEELAEAEPTGRLFEPISPRFCRVPLGDWRRAGLAPEWLVTLFLWSAEQQTDPGLLAEYHAIVGQIAPETGVFSREEWEQCLSTYSGGAVRHSERYRERAHPAYRVLDLRCLPVISILTAIAARSPRIIAIDGRCASGKSTTAALLSRVLGADVVHMDDFFLPPALRTPARLAEPGGNVDYDRFAQEVLPRLSSSEPFAYRIFDCGRMELNGQRQLGSARVRIVEGSYSHHPRFGAYADLRVFLTTSPEEQMRRILVRNGARMAERFRTLWIPMEEAYFAHFEIDSRADLRIDIGELV